MGNYADLREKQPDLFVVSNADAILHETLMHQMRGVGDPSDSLDYGDWAEGSAAYDGQRRNPEIMRRFGTMVDHLQTGHGRDRPPIESIRPLLREDQAKLEGALKPITRKYEQ
jgi:hypothetical protein